MSDLVVHERIGAVGVVTLNNPSKLNALTSAMRRQLMHTLLQLNAEDSVRAIVVTGAGRAFCAGQDLNEAVGYDLGDIRDWLGEQRATYQTYRDLTKPCIAAINGTAAGAGFQNALCCDLRITAEDVKLGQPEVRAGLASIVGSYLLSLHVGLTRNAELSLEGSFIDGRRAYEIGLVNELVDRDGVLELAIERAEKLSRLDPVAIMLTKRRFREMTQAGFDNACEAGVRSQLEAYAAGGPQRLMLSFLTKAA